MSAALKPTNPDFDAKTETVKQSPTLTVVPQTTFELRINEDLVSYSGRIGRLWLFLNLVSLSAIFYFLTFCVALINWKLVKKVILPSLRGAKEIPDVQMTGILWASIGLLAFGFAVCMYATVGLINRRVKDLRGTTEKSGAVTFLVFLLMGVPVISLGAAVWIYLWPGKPAGLPSPDAQSETTTPAPQASAPPPVPLTPAFDTQEDDDAPLEPAQRTTPPPLHVVESPTAKAATEPVKAQIPEVKSFAFEPPPPQPMSVSSAQTPAPQPPPVPASVLEIFGDPNESLLERNQFTPEPPTESAAPRTQTQAPPPPLAGPDARTSPQTPPPLAQAPGESTFVPPPIPFHTEGQQEVTQTGLQTALPKKDQFGQMLLAIPFISALLLFAFGPQVLALPTIVVIACTILIYQESKRFGAGSETDLTPKGKKREAPATWAIVTFLLWIVAYPAWFKRRAYYGAGNQFGASVGVAILFFVATCTAASGEAFLGSFSDSKEVQMVKSGSLAVCPGQTVEHAVNNFFANPKWESGTTNTGETFVNIRGGITYMNAPAQAALQFKIQGNAFNYNALEINGAPQNNLMALGLLGKLCGN